MNSQDNSGKYIDFFTVKLLTSDEGLYKSVFVVLLIYIYAFYIKRGILVPQPFATKEIS